MRFICLFAVLLGSAQAAEHRELAAFLEDHLIESNAPSGAAAAMVDGNIVWTWASGYADIANREKATPTTAYSIASVTKPVTAAAILQLVEKGRIDIDAPANRFLASPLSSAYGDSEQITVRMLLNHTSGLPRHYKFYYSDDQAPLGDGDFIERYGQALLPPGQAFDYSNAGYGVLERIIEHVSGLGYEEYLRARIYEKAGMERAFIPPVEAPRGPEATRYRHYDEPVPFYDFDHRGASSMYASVTDLLNFANSLMVTGDRPGLLSAASATQMWPTTKEEDSYGLGFAVWNKDGETIAHHAGGMPGVSARLMFVPRTRTAVVFLMNTGGDSWDPTVRILREFQPELFLDEAPANAVLLEGSWRGRINLDSETAVPLEMRFTDRGWFGGGTISTQPLFHAPLFETSRGATGLMLRHAELSISEAADYPHGLRFMLMPEGDLLRGYVSAQERPTRGRIGNAVSFPIVLERVAASPEAGNQSE